MRTRTAARTPSSARGRRSCVTSSGRTACAMRRASRGSDLPTPRLARAFIRAASETRYPASAAARARRAPYVPTPSTTHNVSRSPSVRRPTQATARWSPAAVAGNCPSSMTSPVGQAKIANEWVRAWASTPMTNGWVCATIDMGDRRSFLVTGHGVSVTKRPAPVREEVTSGHICDGPRPNGSGSLLIRSPRWAGRRRPRSPTRTIQPEDTAETGQLLRESHARQRDRNHPDQPVPDQPPATLTDGFGAAVGDAGGVEVGQHLGPPGSYGAAEPGDLG